MPLKLTSIIPYGGVFQNEIAWGNAPGVDNHGKMIRERGGWGAKVILSPRTARMSGGKGRRAFPP
jgi:hypothetical protein